MHLFRGARCAGKDTFVVLCSKRKLMRALRVAEHARDELAYMMADLRQPV